MDRDLLSIRSINFAWAVYHIISDEMDKLLGISGPMNICSDYFREPIFPKNLYCFSLLIWDKLAWWSI